MNDIKFADLPDMTETHLVNSMIQEAPAWLTKVSEKISDGPKFYFKKYFAIGDEANIARGSCHFFRIRKGKSAWKIQIALNNDADAIYYLSPEQGWVLLFKELHSKGKTINKYLQMAVKILST